MYDLMETVEHWLAAGEAIALATVVQTWGSAPRRTGAKMAVTRGLAMIGSVSGGCVETAVVEEAADVIERRKPRLLSYGVADHDAWEVGLACGGTIRVWVEPLNTAWWRVAAESAQHDRGLLTITLLDGEAAGAKIAFNDERQVVYADPRLSADAIAALLRHPLAQQTREAALDDQSVLLDYLHPRPHLVMIGGVHIAMALQRFALLLGFRVTLIDPRRAFATSERFPDVDRIMHAYPDKALTELGITPHTYIAVLTHDPKIDDPALKAALAAQPAYIGVLGSRSTHEKRRARLREAGFGEADLQRLKAPIGLNLGAGTPEEIALAIIAEITTVRNQQHNL